MAKKKTKTKKPATSKKKVSKKKGAKKKLPKKTATKKVAASKAVTATTRNKAKKTAAVSNDEKRMMIAMHAYYKWENAGFPHGEDYRHWLEAEEEVAAMLE